MVFCFFLLDTNARRPGRLALGLRLHLSAVDPQLHALGGGVSEHVGQRLRPGLAGHREPALGQQRPDLPGRAGDSAVVHAVEHRQRGPRPAPELARYDRLTVGHDGQPVSAAGAATGVGVGRHWESYPGCWNKNGQQPSVTQTRRQALADADHLTILNAIWTVEITQGPLAALS